MDIKKYWLVAFFLGSMLVVPPVWFPATPAWAQTSDPVCTIVNNSGYPDNQVYISFIGKVSGVYHRLVWNTGAFVQCLETDNTLTVEGQADKYCEYYTTLDKIKKPDGKYTFTVPKNDGGRLWISFANPVYFHINTGGGLREPSTDNSADPNYQTQFDKFEITYDSFGVTANTTCVDFYCLPLMFEMKNGSTSLGKLGLNRTQQAVVQALAAGVQTYQMVTPYRVLSPMTLNPGVTFPNDYFNNYVNYCWDYYTTHTLTLTVKGYMFTGTVTGDVLSLANASLAETHTISRPSSRQVIDCTGAGVFDPAGTGDFNARDGQIKDQVNMALNRSVMHLSDWTIETNFYKQNGLTDAQYRPNIYAKILHSLGIDRKIYAFPMDEMGWASKLEQQPATDIILTINLCKGGGSIPSTNVLLLSE